MQFYQMLNKIKKDMGLTNVKIAEYAEVSESAVRSWLANSKTPNISSVALLCDKLNFNIGWLLTGEETTLGDISEDERFIIDCYRELTDKVDREYVKGELARIVREQRSKKETASSNEKAI